MDLARDRIAPVYFRYLAAAFGSSFLYSIYWVVDMAMVGHYQGPAGTAALSIVSPVWNIIVSIGSLTGIGGSVLFASEAEKKEGQGYAYYTLSVISTAVIAAALWISLLVFGTPLLKAFGATPELLPLARRYLLPVKCALPVFLVNPVLAAFLRNDGCPELATGAVVLGGVFNIFGDWFFIFALSLGIIGAGLATSLGSAVTLAVMLTHFLSPRNTLRPAKPVQPFRKLGQIVVTGFPTFFLDIAIAILSVLFNIQILRYLGVAELSVYGLIANISTFVQCCAYGVGQASQPVISVNLGAGQLERIRQVIRLALLSIVVLALFWLLLCLCFPEPLVHLFMKPTEEVLGIAPGIIRRYSLSFPLLLFNIFSTYCLQALLKPGAAFAVSLSRGCLVSGVLILLLPALFGSDAIWYAMPLAELIVAVPALLCLLAVLGTQRRNGCEQASGH